MTTWQYDDGSGRDTAHNVALSSDQLLSIRRSPGSGALGSRVKKAVWKRFQDDAFTKEIASDGLMGPMLHMTDGDVALVTVSNTLDKPIRFRATGFAVVVNGTVVPPGGIATFSVYAHRRAPRLETSPHAEMELYSADIDGCHECGLHAGLFGPIIWYDPSYLVDGYEGERKARDVDRELVVVTHELDETKSGLAYLNAEEAGIAVGNLNPLAARHAGINGRSFGAAQIKADAGEVVRIHWASIGGNRPMALELEHHPMPVHALSPDATGPATIMVARSGRHLLESPTYRAMSAVLLVSGDAEEHDEEANVVLFMRSVQVYWNPNAGEETTSEDADAIPMCVYRQFDREGNPMAREAHWGVVGPLIHLIADQVVDVNFENRCGVPTGIQFSALELLDDLDADSMLVPTNGTMMLRYHVAHDALNFGSSMYAPPLSQAASSALRLGGLVGVMHVSTDPVDMKEAMFVALRVPDGRATLNGFARTVPALTFDNAETALFHVAAAYTDSALGVLSISSTGDRGVLGDPLANGVTTASRVDMPIVAGPHAITLTATNAHEINCTMMINRVASEERSRELERLRVAPRREYFLTLDAVDWNYAPAGRSASASKDCASFEACWPTAAERRFTQASASRVGTTYRRAMLTQHQTSSFNSPVERDAKDAYLGFLGPMLRVGENELLIVTIQNNLDVSIGPLDIDGMEMLEGEGGDDLFVPISVAKPQTAPGASHTFVFRVRHRDVALSTYAAAYVVDVDGVAVHGAAVVTKAGAERSQRDLHPKDVEHELLFFATVVDENKSPLLNVPAGANRDDAAFQSSNRMPCINGIVGAPLEKPHVHEAEVVRVYVLGAMAASPASSLYFETVHMDTFPTKQSVRVLRRFNIELNDAIGAPASTVSSIPRFVQTFTLLPNLEGEYPIKMQGGVDPVATPLLAQTALIVEVSDNGALERQMDPLLRPFDGFGVLPTLPSSGAAGTPTVRIVRPSIRALDKTMPRAQSLVDQLFHNLPQVGSRRKPAVSVLLNAYTLMVTHDMVRLAVNRTGVPMCASVIDGDSDNNRTCFAYLKPVRSSTRTPLTNDQWQVLAEAAQVQSLDGDEGDVEAAFRYGAFPNPNNAESHWIDGSHIYGVSNAQARAIRTFEGGLITEDINKWHSRNAPIQLVALVELFVREHNFRAREAAKKNPQWNDDRLFQEARRLVIAALQRIAVDEWAAQLTGEALPPYSSTLLSVTAAEQLARSRFGQDSFNPDEHGEVSTLFAMACAPALELSGLPSMVEILNSALQPVHSPADGADVGGGLDSRGLETDRCSGSPEKAARCLKFGTVSVLRGMYAAVAPGIDASIASGFESLRLGDLYDRRVSGEVDAAAEWVMRGRAAMVPKFADILRAYGRPVPATFAALVGLPEKNADGTLVNVTMLADRAVNAARQGALFDESPLIARSLERLYPGGVEQLDAIVGMLVEPPKTVLLSSVGPTLGRCVVDQLRRTRRSDRFWYANNVTSSDELAPPGESLLRVILLRNYNFRETASGTGGGVTRARGTLHVPRDLETAVGVVSDFVRRSFTGGGARALRLGFHASATYEPETKKFGSSPDCFNYAAALDDPDNNGLERVPKEVRALRDSAGGASLRSITDADLFTLIGAVGATTASFGGVEMNWRPGRLDVQDKSTVPDVCPMAGKLPKALVDMDVWPYVQTSKVNRDKFVNMGFNDREFVALVGAHTIGGVQKSTSGFPSGVWTLRRDQFANTFFTNLLAFEEERYRETVRNGDKVAYRLLDGPHGAEVGVLMLPSDIALLADDRQRRWVVKYASDNAAFLRDFSYAYQRLVELGAPNIAPLPPLPDTLNGETDTMGIEASIIDGSFFGVDNTRAMNTSDGRVTDSSVDAELLNVPGAPPVLPFYALRNEGSERFAFEGSPPDILRWQITLQPLPTLRVSLASDEQNIHLLLETPGESYVGVGFGPRLPDASMEGADIVLVSLQADGTMLLQDSFVPYDLAPPIADSELNEDSVDDWFDLRAERADGITRYWMSRKRDTGDAVLDNAVPDGQRVETLFATGTATLRDGTSEDMYASYHGGSRVALDIDWSTPPPEIDVDASEPETRAVVAIEMPEENLSDAILIGSIVGGLCLLLLLAMGVAAFCFVRKSRRDLESQLLLDDDLLEEDAPQIPDGVPELDVNAAYFPLSLTFLPSALFRDPVKLDAFNEKEVVERRQAQLDAGVSVRGLPMLEINTVYCDILHVVNKSTSSQQVTVYVPEPIPQMRIRVEPAVFKLAAGASQIVVVKVRMLCTTKQKVEIRVGTVDAIAPLPSFKLESELSTSLDFDELRLIDRIGEGSFGVVYRGAWRKQPVAIKLLRQQKFKAAELEDLRVEAKFLSQLRHKNIVEFRGAVFRESQCCLVTECAPHGSLKHVIDLYSIPWDLSIKMCVDMASGVQFLHSSGILHRDIKSDNVLVFSLSAQETVCCKLTDFGSARDATEKEGKEAEVNSTPIYMGNELFVSGAKPTEASDCYALGVLFYEVASEREPWVEIAFAWDVAKAVMAGQRPAWPDVVAANAPPSFLPLVNAMWTQRPALRPALDGVLEQLACCQEEIGDDAGARETRRNLADRDKDDVGLEQALVDVVTSNSGDGSTSNSGSARKRFSLSTEDNSSTSDRATKKKASKGGSKHSTDGSTDSMGRTSTSTDSHRMVGAPSQAKDVKSGGQLATKTGTLGTTVGKKRMSGGLSLKAKSQGMPTFEDSSATSSKNASLGGMAARTVGKGKNKKTVTITNLDDIIVFEAEPYETEAHTTSENDRPTSGSSTTEESYDSDDSTSEESTSEESTSEESSESRIAREKAERKEAKRAAKAAAKEKEAAKAAKAAKAAAKSSKKSKK